jgi:hypothetical protein
MERIEKIHNNIKVVDDSLAYQDDFILRDTDATYNNILDSTEREQGHVVCKEA